MLDPGRGGGIPLARAAAIVGAATLAAGLLVAAAPAPNQAALANGLVLAFAIGAALVLARAARIDQKYHIWGLLAAGLTFFAAAEAYWFVVEGLWQQSVDSLSPADGLYLLGYLAFIVALARSIPRKMVRIRTRLVLEATIVFASMLAIAWILVGRTLASAGLPVADVLVAALYPTLDLALASFLLFLLRGIRRVHRPRILMLGLALLLWTVVDAIYAVQVVTVGYASGLPTDGLWAGGYLSFALAALVRLDTRTVQYWTGDPWWAGVLYAPLVLVVPLLAYDYWAERALDPTLAAIVLVLITALAVRQALYTRELVRAHEEHERHALAMEEAQAIAHVGSWELDLRNNTLQLSKEARNIFGLGSEEPVSYDVIMRLLHPDDHDRVESTFWDSVERQLPFEVEHRVIVDGQTKVLTQLGTTVYDAKGPVRSIGTVQDITERRRVQEIQRFQAQLLRSVDQTVIATDTQGRIIYWNDAAQRMYGWRREEVLGRDATGLMPMPESRDRSAAALGMLQGGHTWSGEIMVRDKVGRTFWVEANVGPFTGDDGRLAGFIGIAQDITERKALETDLGERVKELRALSAVATKSSQTEDVAVLLKSTVEMLEPAFLYDDAWIGAAIGPHSFTSEGEASGESLAHDFDTALGRGHIEVRYRGHHAKATIGPFLREEERLLEAVADILTAFAHRIQTMDALARREAALQETQAVARLGSWTWRPSTGEAWWSNEMYNIFERPPGMGPPDIDTIMELVDPEGGDEARAAVEALAENGGSLDMDVGLQMPSGTHKWIAVRAYVPKRKAGPDAMVAGTVQDITTRVRAEAELRFQADLLATVGQAVFATDLEGTITFWNAAARRLFGWDQIEALGRPIATILGEEQTMETPAEPTSSDYRVHRKDGKRIVVQLSTSHFLDERGRLVGFIGVAQDVTEERAMQKRFREVVQASPAGIFQMTWDGRILLANPEYARIAGYPSVEALKAAVPDVRALYADPAQRDAIKSEVQEAGRVHGVEFQIRRPDGSARWVRADVNLDEVEGEKVLNGFMQDITEERRIKQRYQDLVEHSPDGIFRTTEGGALQFSNREAASILGYDSAQELMAAVPRVTDLYVDPEDRKQFIEMLHKEASVPFETRFRRRDGSHVWIEIRARLHEEPGAEPVIEGTFHDLTARRERDELMRRLAAVVEFSEEAIYTMDLDGVITTWNAAAASMFGYSAEEAVGRPLTDLIVPPDKLAEYNRFMQRMRAGESIPRHDNVRRRKDGSGIDVSLALVPIRDGAGKIVSVSVTADDISDRLRAEEAEKARLENEHLKELDQTLRDFINAAAHDLNQPLTPMKIALTTLADVPDPSPALVGKTLQTVKRSVERMELLVADLLDVARLESGTLRFDFEATDLRATLAEVHEFFSPAAAERGLDWAVEGGDVEVMVDRRRLMQVLFNLVGNAFKFVQDGGRVRVRADRRGAMVRFEVEDDGLGLTADQVARLFRPFSQVHEVAEAPKGTGLGLYISMGIVERHSGTMGVSSPGPGKGSTFWFEIPVDQPA